MVRRVSDKKSVTGLGAALAEFLKENRLSVSKLACLMAESEPDSDVESHRRSIQRWLKGQRLQEASVRRLDKALAQAGLGKRFQVFLERRPRKPPILEALPSDPADWEPYAWFDLFYLFGHGQGDVGVDEETLELVSYGPDTAAIRDQARELAGRVWTFFRRTKYQWEPGDFLDLLFRDWRRSFFDELHYRTHWLMEDIDYQSYENAEYFASWCACRSFTDCAADPKSEAPVLRVRSTLGEALEDAERCGPLYSPSGFGGWPGRWVEPPGPPRPTQDDDF